MPRLTIDNLLVEVPPGTKVIQAAEKLGIVIPRLCFHQALGSVGACRMCAVKFLKGPVEGIEMSCMVAAQDGMVVSTDDPEAREFRRFVIEWLMLNHPHDCPVCDEGGHCLLQDTTVSGGHGIRRYRGPKRTYQDQDLGPFLQHEMNRCIHCFRCHRFYQEYAGYRDLGTLRIGERTYFGRYISGRLESPFAGNLADICPTGVFTDKPSRYKGRRWNLQRGPSLCLHCSLGCNTTASVRLREVIRQEGRPHREVNDYFLCDRGRYGFDYANHPQRPRRPVVEGSAVDWTQALPAAASALRAVAKAHGPQAVACLGSARASLEAQAGLVRLCQEQGWPAPRFFARAEQAVKTRGAVEMLTADLAVSQQGLRESDFILVVGADPLNEAPLAALALRRAQQAGAQVTVLDPRPVFLPLEFSHLAAAPGQVGPGLDWLVGRALARSAGQLSGPWAQALRQHLQTVPSPGGSLERGLEAAALSLAQSRRPVLLCSTDWPPPELPARAGALAGLLRQAKGECGLFYLLSGPNAFGAALLSAGEEQQPELVEQIERRQVRALLLAESDPFWDCLDRQRLELALEKLDLLVVLDYLPSPSLERAHMVLPTTTVFETGGSFINQEGRLQLAVAIQRGGTPLSQISPDRHPPREIVDYLPGGDPRPAGWLLDSLGQALTGGQRTEARDIWSWLAGRDPLWSQVLAEGRPAYGRRALPAQPRREPFISLPTHAEEAGPQDLELLLVDWTFGSEELASYSRPLLAAEAEPFLAMHPQDAAELGLAAGARVALRLARGRVEAGLRLQERLARGVMVLPRHHGLTWQGLTTSPARIPRGHLREA